jgi:hypothetical protein
MSDERNMTATQGEFEPTDQERAYMAAPPTDAELKATKGMPRLVANGWITRQRAEHLAKKRGDQRTERISEALMKLVEAMR